MNLKTLNFITASALLLASAYPASSPAAGGGKCAVKRPLSASEKSGFQAAVRAIIKAMPPAPEGWTVQESAARGDAPDSICETPGCPLEYTCQVSFINEKNILESIKKFERSKSAERMERLASEMSAAAEKGDSKKLRKIEEEMEILNSTPAGKMTARILVRINPARAAGNIRQGGEIPVPGAKFGYLVENRNGKKIVLYSGRWNRRGEFGVYPEPDRSWSNAAVQFLEIVIEGDIAEELTKTLNMNALNTLMK